MVHSSYLSGQNYHLPFLSHSATHCFTFDWFGSGPVLQMAHFTCFSSQSYNRHLLLHGGTQGWKPLYTLFGWVPFYRTYSTDLSWIPEHNFLFIHGLQLTELFNIDGFHCVGDQDHIMDLFIDIMQVICVLIVILTKKAETFYTTLYLASFHSAVTYAI